MVQAMEVLELLILVAVAVVDLHVTLEVLGVQVMTVYLNELQAAEVQMA